MVQRWESLSRQGDILPAGKPYTIQGSLGLLKSRKVRAGIGEAGAGQACPQMAGNALLFICVFLQREVRLVGMWELCYKAS